MFRYSAAFALLLVTNLTAAQTPRSVEFFVNQVGSYDHGRAMVIPSGFGDGEFTLEAWVRLNASYPVGSTADTAEGQRLNWADRDRSPYSSYDWWYHGNFLLDGHNNGNQPYGTFGVQIYGGGRVRWLFGDGASVNRQGGLWAVQAYPATNAASLLDGQWHHLAFVRRWSASSAAILELWVDGGLIDTETTPVRTNMRQWWNSWSVFPPDQTGWFWAAEKQAATSSGFGWEDYKGRIDELRFWSRAKSAIEITSGWNASVNGTEAGLVGWYSFTEGQGTAACNHLTGGQCITLHRMKAGYWTTDNAPLSGQAPPPQPVPTLQFAANPTSVASGSSSVLAWSSSNVGSCTASGGWSGSLALSGSEPTGPLSTTTTFTITCSGTNGSISRSATVTVTANPPPPPPPPPSNYMVYSCPDTSRVGTNAYDCESWSWNYPSAGLVASCGRTTCSWSDVVTWRRFEDVLPEWAVSACLSPIQPGSRNYCSNDSWTSKASLSSAPPSTEGTWMVRRSTAGAMVRAVYSRSGTYNGAPRGSIIRINGVSAYIYAGAATDRPICDANDTARTITGTLYMRVTAPAVNSNNEPLAATVTGYVSPCDRLQ